jgi:hypothetical protein
MPPKGDAMTLVSAADVPGGDLVFVDEFAGLYAPFMLPTYAANHGRTTYFTLSKWVWGAKISVLPANRRFLETRTEFWHPTGHVYGRADALFGHERSGADGCAVYARLLFRS